SSSQSLLQCGGKPPSVICGREDCKVELFCGRERAGRRAGVRKRNPERSRGIVRIKTTTKDTRSTRLRSLRAGYGHTKVRAEEVFADEAAWVSVAMISGFMGTLIIDL